MEQLKAKCKQIVYGKPPMKAEGWMLRPDLVFDMYSAKNNYGEGAKVRAGEQAREKEVMGDGTKKRREPRTFAEMEALMYK